jgi:hypothetical protein
MGERPGLAPGKDGTMIYSRGDIGTQKYPEKWLMLASFELGQHSQPEVRDGSLRGPIDWCNRVSTVIFDPEQHSLFLRRRLQQYTTLP